MLPSKGDRSVVLKATYLYGLMIIPVSGKDMHVGSLAMGVCDPRRKGEA